MYNNTQFLGRNSRKVHDRETRECIEISSFCRPTGSFIFHSIGLQTNHLSKILDGTRNTWKTCPLFPGTLVAFYLRQGQSITNFLWREKSFQDLYGFLFGVLI